MDAVLEEWNLSRSVFLVSVLLLFIAPLHARPLLTEEVQTLGPLYFETGVAVSYRRDQFNNPRRKYDTVNFPVHFGLGLTDKLDVGFSLTHVSQRIDFNDESFSGSANALFDPQIKYSPNPYLGFITRLRYRRSEQNEDLPIGRGNDLELLALTKLPVKWPVQFNVGYLFRDGYQTRFGVPQATQMHLTPGNVLEFKGAIEAPVVWHLNLLLEGDYYKIWEDKLAGQAIPGTAGSASDILTGLTWAYGGFNIGGGVGFGLGNESHTSFEYDKGLGDITYQFALSYKLRPSKPQS